MNLLTLPLVNPRHRVGKLKGFAYLLFEAFMRAYFDAYMTLHVSSGAQATTTKHEHTKTHVAMYG